MMICPEKFLRFGAPGFQPVPPRLNLPGCFGPAPAMTNLEPPRVAISHFSLKKKGLEIDINNKEERPY